MTSFRERLVELLGCDDDDDSILDAVVLKNREIGQYRRQMAEIRGQRFKQTNPRPEPLTIALDFDDTFTADAALWSHIIDDIRQQGHIVVCISSRRDTLENQNELKRSLPDGVGIHLCYDEPKQAYAKRNGIDVNIWIDDFPRAITEGR